MWCRRDHAALILAFSIRFPARVYCLLGQHLVNNFLKIPPLFLAFPSLPQIRVYGDNHLISLYLWLSPHIPIFPQIRAENPRVPSSILGPATINVLRLRRVVNLRVVSPLCILIRVSQKFPCHQIIQKVYRIFKVTWGQVGIAHGR